MTLLVGIDEAGRGPAIGPLIIVGVVINEEDQQRLKTAGVKDSKLLTSKKLIELQKVVDKIIENKKIIIIPPEEIDNAVFGHDGLNLNWLEARKSAEILNILNPEKAILDCPSPNITAYKNYVRKFLKNQEMELIVEHKADKNHPVVAAASILAKNTREEEVKKIEKKIGQSIGSGYMSNKICQKFVKNNFQKHPKFFRKSWSSFRTQVEKKEQKKIEEF